MTMKTSTPSLQEAMQFLLNDTTPEINGLIRTLDLELVSFLRRKNH